MMDEGGRDAGARRNARDSNVFDSLGRYQLTGRLEDALAGGRAFVGLRLGRIWSERRRVVRAQPSIPRSARMRLANQPTATSRAESGPGLYPVVARPV